LQGRDGIFNDHLIIANNTAREIGLLVYRLSVREFWKQVSIRYRPSYDKNVGTCC